MTKVSKILQKKLDELTSSLNKAISLPPDDKQSCQLYSREIEQSIVFLKKILSAEIASSPAKAHQLRHVDKRLLELENVFHKWDEYKKVDVDHVENDSTCSCTESCLNEDGEGSVEGGSLDFEEAKSVWDGVVGENTTEKMETVGVAEKEEDREMEGRFCRGLACGMAIGVSLMGFVSVRLCGCYSSVENAVCIAPT